MYLSCLRREQHLAWLHAYVHVLYSAEAEVGAWPVQHDGAAGVDHVCLEEHLIDVAVVVDDFELGCREMETPVNEVGIYDVDGMVFELAIETRDFKDFAEDADGVDKVGKGGEGDLFGGEGGVIVFLEGMGVWYLLLEISTGLSNRVSAIKGSRCGENHAIEVGKKSRWFAPTPER